MSDTEKKNTKAKVNPRVSMYIVSVANHSQNTFKRYSLAATSDTGAINLVKEKRTGKSDISSVTIITKGEVVPVLMPDAKDSKPTTANQL